MDVESFAAEKLYIINGAKEPFDNCKLFYFQIPDNIVVGRRYLLNNVPEISRFITTGIDWYAYEPIQPMFPYPVYLEGKTYNPLSILDAGVVRITFCDAKGKWLLYRSVLTTFARTRVPTIITPQIETRRYELPIYTGKSYVEFFGTLITPTNNPRVIPLMFYYDFKD